MSLPVWPASLPAPQREGYSTEGPDPLVRGRDGALGVAVTGRSGSAPASGSPVNVSVNIRNEGRDEVRTERGPDGSIEVLIKPLEAAIGARATRGRGPLAPAISNPAYRVGRPRGEP